MSKPSSFSRLALPIFRWTAMIIGALIGSVQAIPIRRVIHKAT